MPVKKLYRAISYRKLKQKASFVPPYKPKTPCYSITKYTRDLGRALRSEDIKSLEHVMDRWKHIYDPQAYSGYKKADDKTKTKIMYLMIKNNKELVSDELYQKAKDFVDTEIYGHKTEEEPTEETDNEI